MSVTCLRGTLGLGPNIGIDLYDFSEEGIRLTVTMLLVPDEEVEVCLAPVFQSKAVSITGTVIWSCETKDGFWAGVRLSRRLTYPELGILT
jgi:hypothetical protein